jgi:hypothetical protein
MHPSASTRRALPNPGVPGKSGSQYCPQPSPLPSLPEPACSAMQERFRQLESQIDRCESTVLAAWARFACVTTPGPEPPPSLQGGVERPAAEPPPALSETSRRLDRLVYRMAAITEALATLVDASEV